MSVPIRYRIKRVDRAANKNIVLGQTVYEFVHEDYGLASNDSRYMGVKHTSVTLDPIGGYPCFTIPIEDLEQLP